MKGEHFVTCGQMRILEKRASENGLSYYQMMENAGRRAADIIMTKTDSAFSTKKDGRRFFDLTDTFNMKNEEALKVAEKIEPAYKEKNFGALIFCGKGNNGGDGLVCARLLREAGWKITVVLIDGKPHTEDSMENFRRLEGLNIDIEDMSVNSRVLMDVKRKCDVIVDAIYGTGFHGKLKENALKAAIYINKQRRSKSERIEKSENGPIVFSLDIPSGLGGDITDEREMDTMSVKADFTIAFHARKPVHIQSFAKKFCGDTIVANIGIDEERLWNVEL